MDKCNQYNYYKIMDILPQAKEQNIILSLITFLR